MHKPFSVIAKPVTTSSTPDEREPATGFAVILYIKGVTEPIKRILNGHNVKVAQKPFQTLGHMILFPKNKSALGCPLLPFLPSSDLMEFCK